MKVGNWGNIIKFKVSENKILTFQDGMEKTSSAQFQTHTLCNGKPKLQFIAPGLENVHFTMELNAALCKHPVRYEQSLRRAQRSGKYAPLVIGGRCILNNAIITEMSVSYDKIVLDGKIAAMKIDVTMSEYN